jgi:hypothetical protein
MTLSGYSRTWICLIAWFCVANLALGANTNGAGKVILRSVQTSPHPGAAIVEDCRTKPRQMIFLHSGISTNGIMLIAVDVSNGSAILTVDGITNHLSLFGANDSKWKAKAK